MFIHAENLTRKFGEITAVDGLNLDVARGEVFGLVGPDGAGKTTTLRMLCGLLDPTGGRASVAGYEVAKNPDAVKDRIGYMAQKFGLYGDLTVQENMVFYSDLFGIGGRERDELMTRLLQMTRMEPFRARPAAKVSGGMKQKLALMCTLLHHPEVLFLDEPTNGVDPVSRRDFWTILRQLVKDAGITVFVTTAYLDEAERCDRVGLMDHGRLIEIDSPDAIKQVLSEKCLEVRAANNRTAREILSTQRGVLSADPSGAAVHVFADPRVVSAASIHQLLTERGLAPVAVREIVPSLEDMFIALVRKEGRNAA
jgi:ABC-2 type transport system ATP-binding protein